MTEKQARMFIKNYNDETEKYVLSEGMKLLQMHGPAEHRGELIPKLIMQHAEKYASNHHYERLCSTDGELILINVGKTNDATGGELLLQIELGAEGACLVEYGVPWKVIVSKKIICIGYHTMVLKK